MPAHFDRFRFLNGAEKEVENVSYQVPLRVQVDAHPEVIIEPGEKKLIPDGHIIEVVAEREVP